MPALGTHRPLGPAESRLMFGDALTADRLLVHRWRDDVETIGEIAAEEVDALAGRPIGLPLPFTVNRALVGGGYDLVVSVGQVVPHEVAGYGGYTKHLCIGLGGRETIQRSHFVGAICGIEETLGRVDAPVRELLDRGFDRFLEPRCRALFVLTVVESRADGQVLRGVFAGEGGTRGSGGAAFRAAVELAGTVNVVTVDEPFRRCVAYLNPDEYHSTWLGNKAIYRTRLALADGGELFVVAPGVTRFGEDDVVDDLIRRHGYRGRQAALAAMAADRELAANLAAVAHLVHGSTEGRFEVVYCCGEGLDRAAVEGVGFRYLPLDGGARALPARRGRGAGRPLRRRAVRVRPEPRARALAGGRAVTLPADRLLEAPEPARALALELYERVAGLPIVSPHGHIDAGLFVRADARLEPPGALFVTGDHYVLRLLYSQGVPLERLGVRPLDGGAARDRRPRGLAALRRARAPLRRHADRGLAAGDARRRSSASRSGWTARARMRSTTGSRSSSPRRRSRRGRCSTASASSASRPPTPPARRWPTMRGSPRTGSAAGSGRRSGPTPSSRSTRPAGGPLSPGSRPRAAGRSATTRASSRRSRSGGPRSGRSARPRPTTPRRARTPRRSPPPRLRPSSRPRSRAPSRRRRRAASSRTCCMRSRG